MTEERAVARLFWEQGAAPMTETMTPLPRVRDPDAGAPGGCRELCAICRRNFTFMWYEPKDVPVCDTCAPTTRPEDVPTKAEYWPIAGERATL